MIIKFDVEMFQDVSWKSIYFGLKRSKVKVTSHKNIAIVGLCTLVSVAASIGYYSKHLVQ